MNLLNQLGTFFLLILLWVILLLILLPGIPVFLMIFLIKTIEQYIYYVLYDAIIFESAEKQYLMDGPCNLMVINGVLQLNGVTTICKFRELVKQRLIHSTDESGNKIYPKATRHVHSGYLNYYWIEDDMHFDINDHVYELKTKATCEEDLQNIISQHCNKALITENHKSPWEFILLSYTVTTV